MRPGGGGEAVNCNHSPHLVKFPCDTDYMLHCVVCGKVAWVRPPLASWWIVALENGTREDKNMLYQEQVKYIEAKGRKAFT